MQFAAICCKNTTIRRKTPQNAQNDAIRRNLLQNAGKRRNLPQFVAKCYIARPPVPKRGIWHVIGILYILVLSSTPFHPPELFPHPSWIVLRSFTQCKGIVRQCKWVCLTHPGKFSNLDKLSSLRWFDCSSVVFFVLLFVVVDLRCESVYGWHRLEGDLR